MIDLKVEAVVSWRRPGQRGSGIPTLKCGLLGARIDREKSIFCDLTVTAEGLAFVDARRNDLRKF